MLPKSTYVRSITTVILLLFATMAFAQKNISGKVTGAPNNQPIYGATVAVKGTTVATQTNAEGAFTLRIPNEKSILVVTFVGYEPVEMPAGDRTTIEISLKETSSTLTDVVVTGYSSQAKKDITGSVSVVNTKELVANPGSNVESLLQGRAAGV